MNARADLAIAQRNGYGCASRHRQLASLGLSVAALSVARMPVSGCRNQSQRSRPLPSDTLQYWSSMCGIAGIVDLAGNASDAGGRRRRMTQAIIHRGPDEEGYFRRPGLALGSRRLSIVGLADGQQPVANEDRSVSVVFNGELFDYPEKTRGAGGARASAGRRIATRKSSRTCGRSTREEMFERLRGQFAIALWDERRRMLVLGRDRFGICPLYWTRQGDWLLFASEIKALLASGHGAGAARPARHRPRLHLCRDARADHLF